jgi:hypothetical protein
MSVLKTIRARSKFPRIAGQQEKQLRMMACGNARGMTDRAAFVRNRHAVVSAAGAVDLHSIRALRGGASCCRAKKNESHHHKSEVFAVVLSNLVGTSSGT